MPIATTAEACGLPPLKSPALKPRATLLSYKGVRRGALVGIASIRLPNGLSIFKVMVFASGERRWASLPAEPMLDRDGTALKDESGKRRYAPLLEWPDKATRDAFSSTVVALVLEQHPDAFNAAGAA